MNIDNLIIPNVVHGHMITALDSRVLDANSEVLGVSVETLMRNAGFALASAASELSKGRMLFICGSGNNGGDGYAAYQLLKDRADVCAFREPKSQLCKMMAEGIVTVPFEKIELGRYDVLVDCVLGTGPSGELRPEYSEYVRFVNSSGKKVAVNTLAQYYIDHNVPTDLSDDALLALA